MYIHDAGRPQPDAQGLYYDAQRHNLDAETINSDGDKMIGKRCANGGENQNLKYILYINTLGVFLRVPPIDTNRNLYSLIYL